MGVFPPWPAYAEPIAADAGGRHVVVAHAARVDLAARLSTLNVGTRRGVLLVAGSCTRRLFRTWHHLRSHVVRSDVDDPRCPWLAVAAASPRSTRSRS